MKFVKAVPEQGFLKISLYGPPGAGKTFTTLLFAEGLAKKDGKRVAYVDTERGTDFYAKEVKARKVHPEAFDFDCIYTRSLLEVLDAVKVLDPEEHSVVVIDSISHLWDAAIAAYEGKKTSVDSIPMHAWGSIKKPYKELVRFLMDSNFHVFILGRQKNLFETDDNDNMKKVGVGMRAEGETAYEPHICARMESRLNSKDSTISTIVIMFEKDRTGVLSGRTFPSPSFKTLEPIMPLLNGKQAHSENPDDVAAKDAELLEREVAKKKDKENKSLEWFTEFNGKITTCKDLPALAEISAELKKKKRYMVDTHIASLREIYNSRRDALTAEVAPVG